MSYTLQYLQSEMAAQGLEVIVLVNCLVQDAIRLAASDLHIEPWEEAIVVRARVNGVLTEVAHLPLDLMDKISARFNRLILAGRADRADDLGGGHGGSISSRL